MKLLIVRCSWFAAGAEYTDSGYPTENVAPILKKYVYGQKTLDKLLEWFDQRKNYEYEVREVT